MLQARLHLQAAGGPDPNEFYLEAAGAARLQVGCQKCGWNPRGLGGLRVTVWWTGHRRRGRER